MDVRDSDSDPLDYRFNTPGGYQLTRKVPHPLLPYGPHDDQLEGTSCKMADGVDIVAYILAVREI
jgi:hypothetical protein